LIKLPFPIFPLLLALCAALPLDAQSLGGVSLASELDRLEKSSQTPAQKNSALAGLGQLYQLSGNRERAAAAYADAARADPAKLDGVSLLKAAKLYIALGEYETAEAAIAAVLAGGGVTDALIREARLLSAECAAFQAQELRPLAALAVDGAYTARRAGLYYTLWRLSGDDAWRAKLQAEYPQTPEAQAAADASSATGVILAASPQWFLYPGREALTLAAPSVAAPAPSPAAPSTAAPPAVLQTGLYSREENARAMAARLTAAGFTPSIVPRQVSGGPYWAVTVPAAADMNTTIMALKNAGFESFPLVTDNR
jgi:hypothetical protein